MSGGGGSNEQTVGYRYSFGIHMGVCRGPIDELCEIRIGDRTAWTGSVTTNESFTIAAADLFGGETGEGGVEGTCEVMMGGPSQTAPSSLATMMGGLVPGFRRRMTMFFDGIVCMINPYPKAWKMRVRRVLQGWDGPVFAPQVALIMVRKSTEASPYGKSLRFTSTSSGGDARLKYDALRLTTGTTWTIEARVKFKGTPLEERTHLFGCWSGNTASGSGWTIDIDRGLGRFYFAADGSGGYTGDFPTTLGTRYWYHLAFVVTMTGGGPYVTAYVDGVLIGSGNLGSINLVDDASQGLVIGSRSDGTLPFNGWMEGVRITEGARYTDAFTPPSGDLPTGPADPMWSSVRLLLLGEGDSGSAVITDSSTHARTPSLNVQVLVDGNAPLDDDSSSEWIDTDSDIHAMNGACIIYECLTNREWGRGLDRTALDTESFTASAVTLFEEGFGLCMRWTREDTIDSFIQQVVNTIGASLYQDRVTGKLVLKLVRNDYVFNELPLFDVESGLLEISESTVASPSDAVNEVIVTYRDPISDTDKKARAQNLATLQASGGVINSASRDYAGIPTADLALRIAKRDLRSSSVALRRFSITLDRRGWNVYVGDVIRIRDLVRSIPDMAVRVGAFEEGSLTDGRIKLTVVQDVFGMPSTAFTATQTSGWTPPNSTPCIGRSELIEIPYALVAKYSSAADFNAIVPESSRFGVLLEVGQPLNNSYDIAVRDGAPTSDDEPTDTSYYCGYTP